MYISLRDSFSFDRNKRLWSKSSDCKAYFVDLERDIDRLLTLNSRQLSYEEIQEDLRCLSSEQVYCFLRVQCISSSKDSNENFLGIVEYLLLFFELIMDYKSPVWVEKDERETRLYYDKDMKVKVNSRTSFMTRVWLNSRLYCFFLRSLETMETSVFRHHQVLLFFRGLALFFLRSCQVINLYSMILDDNL